MNCSVTRRRTTAVNALLAPRVTQGAAVFPIFQSATYEHDPTTSLGYDDVKYARCNNTPAHESLNAKLAALHGAEAAMITGSGMAAITTTLLTFVKARSLLLLTLLFLLILLALQQGLPPAALNQHAAVPRCGHTCQRSFVQCKT